MLSVALEWFVLAYFLGVNTFYATQIGYALASLRAHQRETKWERREWILRSRVAPTITVLMPAYGEEATIAESVRGILALYYARLQVVVVNDGSKDATLERLKEAFELEETERSRDDKVRSKAVRGVYRAPGHANLIVVDKENGGKADALNCALSFATGELVCAIDADTLIEPDALQRMVRPFLRADDVVATGGTIRVVNDSTVTHGRVQQARAARGLIAGFQAIEYVRAFLVGRLALNRMGGNLIISGAFGLFRRDALVAGGGYEADTVGEDMELVVRLRRHGVDNGTASRVLMIPDPVAWTEVPENLKVLGRQRDRWHRGLFDALWRHKRMLFNPRYGAMGMIVMPYFTIVELLAPVVEAVGLLFLGVTLMTGSINPDFAIRFFLVAYGFGIALTLMALLLDEATYPRQWRTRDAIRLVLFALVENLGYRQMTVWWRLKGIVSFLRGRKEWGTMERRGFATERS